MLYERCKLKNGMCGTIVELFEDENECMVELDDKTVDDWLPTVKIEDIEMI